MEGRLFTFLGEIFGHGQIAITLSHYALVLVILFLVVNAATKKMTLVPTGAQNAMEAFITGIIATIIFDIFQFYLYLLQIKEYTINALIFSRSLASHLSH